MHDNIAWLADFRERFDEDVRRLMEKEPLWQKCRNCPDGYCCGHGIYPVTMSRVNPFRLEEWWMMLDYVKANFSENDKKQLIRNVLSKRPDCIFRFGNRCSVHPARAWACRVHPYTISYHPNPEYFPSGQIALPSCPALAPAFGIKRDEEVIQSPSVLARDEESRLVQVKLKKETVWLVDATDYVAGSKNTPATGRPAADWEALLTCGQAGSAVGLRFDLS